MQHAKLSASGSGQWLNCPGSIKAERDWWTGRIITETSSPFAQEGTCAHDLAAVCLQGDEIPHEYIGKTLTDAPEIVVDKEMANYVEEYINYVKSFQGHLMVEIRVDFSPWVPEGFGTSDAIVVDEEAGICHVIDLKYGKGVEVFADNNTQGMLYALGVYNDYDFEYEFDTITIHIYQPRIGNISEWSITVKDLLIWAEETVKPAAELCMTDDAPRYAGNKQCQWCDVKATCPTLMKHVEETISSEFDNLELPTVDDSLDFQNILASKKLIEGWLKAIEGFVFEELEAGNKVPGFKLVKGKSSRKWTDEADVEKYLRKKRLKVGEMFNQKLITPPQAEKFLGKAKYADMDDLVIKSDGKPALANENDKRPALVINVVEEFDVVDNLEEEF